MSKFDELLEKTNYDYFVLDSENAIIMKSGNSNSLVGDYIMFHVRLVDDSLKIMNNWTMSNLTLFQLDLSKFNIPKLGLYKVLLTDYYYNIYDYKKAEFILKNKDFSRIFIDDEELEEDKSFIAMFNISSSYASDDIIYYKDPINNKVKDKNFNVEDGNYFAKINLDGTIRDNKIYKGFNLDQIEEIIDISEYESLKDFKDIRIVMCNMEKERQKRTFREFYKDYLCEEEVKIEKNNSYKRILGKDKKYITIP